MGPKPDCLTDNDNDKDNDKDKDKANDNTQLVPGVPTRLHY